MVIERTSGYRPVQRQVNHQGRYWWMIEFHLQGTWVLVKGERFNSRREAEAKIKRYEA